MTLAEALKALHRVGRIRSEWRPGMLAADGSRCLAVHGAQELWAYENTPGHVEAWWGHQVVAPHLGDEVTVGGLLALLREASGDPLVYLAFSGEEPGDGHWECYLPSVTCCGETEGDAIAEALIALAEAA